MNDPRLDGRLGHAVDHAGLLGLGQGEAALLPDRPQALGPVGAHAGQDDAQRERPVHLRRRDHQHVGRRAVQRVARLLVEDDHDRSAPAGELRVDARGRDQDRAGLDRLPVARLAHGDGAAGVEPLRERLREAARDVLDDEDRRREAGGQAGDDDLEGGGSAGRGGDDDALGRRRARGLAGALARPASGGRAPARPRAPGSSRRAPPPGSACSWAARTTCPRSPWRRARARAA